MEDVIITITVKDGTVKLDLSNLIDASDLMNITFTALLKAMVSTVESQHEEYQDQCKADVYDMFNAGASNTLMYFAPEYEIRPNLTAQAILKAEDDILLQRAENEILEKTIVDFEEQANKLI